MRETGLVLDAKDIVGESLIYDDRRDALVWVDIGGKRIHRLWLADRRHEEWPTPDFPDLDRASIANGDAIVGLRDRVALWRLWRRVRNARRRRTRPAGQPPERG